MNKKLAKLIGRAKKEMDKGKKHRLISFVLDSRFRVISVGYNSYSKTHSLQARLAARTENQDKIYLHSECAALVSIIRNQKRKETNASKIFVVRFNKQGELALANPCEICRTAINLAGIKEIIYTSINGIVTEKFSEV